METVMPVMRNELLELKEKVDLIGTEVEALLEDYANAIRALRGTHSALDVLFAEKVRDCPAKYPDPGFMPTHHSTWPAVVEAHRVLMTEHDLQDCTCDDIDARLRSLSGPGGAVAMQWCTRCDKHYARCKCSAPTFKVRVDGQLREMRR